MGSNMSASLRECLGCPLQPCGPPESPLAGRAGHPPPLRSVKGVCLLASPQCCPGKGCHPPSWSFWCHPWSSQTCAATIAINGMSSKDEHARRRRHKVARGDCSDVAVHSEAQKCYSRPTNTDMRHKHRAIDLEASSELSS